MSSASALLLGLVNVGIIVVILLIIGVVIEWLAKALGFALPGEARKLYLLLVLLIAVYHLIALAFGLPHWRPIG